MATVFVRHPVADYGAWRPHFDGDVDRRKAAGLTDVAVFQNANNPNDVLMVFSAEDTSGVQAMLADEGLKAKMQEAGVTGPPQSFIAE